MTTGLFIGKFLPFHRGHLSAILKSSTQCDMLYVVISQDRRQMLRRCKENNIKEMPLEMITSWMKKELGAFSDHIKIVPIDETSLPPLKDKNNPKEWRKEWVDIAKPALVEAGMIQFEDGQLDLDFMFGSEIGYQEYANKYISKKTKYIMIDLDRSYVNISASELVKNIYKHWDMVPGSVRPYFVKKVLITGIESCGKTVLTQKLAKNFLTSWSIEYGKQYQILIDSTPDKKWDIDDFNNIAKFQLSQDQQAYQTANKVAFIDTDAIVTDYYLGLFMGKEGCSEFIEKLKKEEIDKWDLVILLRPTVQWIQDGTRFDDMKDMETRWKLHDKLKSMYNNYGIKYIEVGGDYKYRFEFSINLVEKLLNKEKNDEKRYSD